MFGFGSDTVRQQASDIYFVRTLGLLAAVVVMMAIGGILWSSGLFCGQARSEEIADLLAKYHGSTMRLRIAYRTSAAGEESLSLRMMPPRCVSTVLTLMFKRPAICLLV